VGGPAPHFPVLKEKTMLAELSVFPADKGGEGLSKYVAESMEIIEASGLDYEIHALGTLIEGPADKVFQVIRDCHENMIRHSNRVMTTVKIDDRKGVTGRIKGKVRSVEEKLGRELPKG
jgi:uncharacterized protein (TIGR00106 family)